MVGHARGVSSMEALRAAGYAVDWHEYPMQHEVVLEEIELVGEFLGARLA
jgi:phospholipase/carboxylesterase